MMEADVTREQAQEAVREIVRDLSDRRGLKWAWDDIDEDIQAEIKKRWADLILKASGSTC